MNPMRLVTLVLGMISAFLLVILPVAYMRRTSAERSARRVRKHFGKTVEAIRDYSSQQRDKAMNKAAKSLEELDSRLDAMEEALYEKWDQMDRETRDSCRKALREFRAQRGRVAEWYGAMRYSSENAWENMKEGFLDSYREIKESLERAAGSFSGQPGASRVT